MLGSMAGGMGRRRTGPSLAERARVGPDASEATDAAVPDDPVRPAAVHHCWVDDAPGHPGRYPGLLLEWRRDQQRWVGLVAYVMPDLQADRVRLVQRWLPGVYLTPADPAAPPRG
jgi:hypothetical protein